MEMPEDRLKGFADWLRERRLAPENRIPFFLRWVERFARLTRLRAGEEWQDTLRVFLEDLLEAQTPDWQIRQAGDAVSLYCGQFLKPGETPPGEAAQTPPLQAEEIVAEMNRLLQLRRYSPRTERSYSGWAKRFLRYLGPSRSSTPTTADVQAYLSYLATRRKVSASTQNQAFNALLFLYRHVFMVEFGEMAATVRAKRGRKIPLVLSCAEVQAVLSCLTGKRRLMVALIYGAGLRLGELVRLRIKDIDFESGSVTVRSGKGDRDRVTLLPRRLKPDLREHLVEVRALHERDLAAGAGEALLPAALARKYPNAGREWAWQFAFPSSRLVLDSEAGTVRRWHVAPATVQKAMKAAVRESRIVKPASVHTLRHHADTRIMPS